MQSQQPPRPPGQSRYWLPLGSEIHADAFGFLLDPEGEYTRHANIAAVKLEDIRDLPCAALLGEPGQGKSTALRDEERSLKTLGALVAFVDLGEVGSDESLVRTVFQAPEWASAAANGKPFHLLLDSFDECRLSINNAAQVLLRELRKIPGREWLRLRIVSRAGVWPVLLDAGLQELWPDEYQSMELAPFRYRDAVGVVEGLGVTNPEAFFQSVRESEARPLVTSPITLRFLAGLHVRGGGLPRCKADLYQQGCLALCTEQNSSRRAAGKTGALSPSQRLAAAARLAAVSIFSDRPGLWLGTESNLPADGWLTVDDVVGGTESANGATFEVTMAAVNEVLTDTGLFAPVGTYGLRWAHRTFQEYLAAHFVQSRSLPPEQLGSLLRHPARVSRVVPQLRGVAAWLGRRADVLRMLLDGDPQALFSVDFDSGSEAERREAVDSIIAAARSIQIDDFHLEDTQYRRLGHPQLEAQLRPVIIAKTENILARRVAIEIAANNCLDQIEDAILAVVLDRGDELHIRSNAAYALGESRNGETHHALSGLLDTDFIEDTEDDLKGHALAAAWPALRSAMDVFSMLSAPKNRNYGGRYSRFLTQELVPALADSDLPVAFAWAGRLSKEEATESVLGSVCDQLLIRAWARLDDPATRIALADVIWGRIQRHDRAVGNRDPDDSDGNLNGNDEGRRRLLCDVLERATTDPNSWQRVQTFRPKLVKAEDLGWLLDQLDSEARGPVRAVLSSLIGHCVFRSDPEGWNRVLPAARRHAELEAVLAPYIRPVTINSPEAQLMRDRHARDIELDRRASERCEETHAPVGERVLPPLERCEGGDLDAWHLLLQELFSTQRGRSFPFHDAVTSSQGWVELDEPLRGRVVAVAERFLTTRGSRQDEWFECGHRPTAAARAGQLALRFLIAAAPERFAKLSTTIWERWLPAVLEAPFWREGAARESGLVVKTAYERAPECFLAWLRLYVLRESNQRSRSRTVGADSQRGEERVQEAPTDVPRKVRECWDSRIADVFRGLLPDSQVSDTVYLDLLVELLRRKDPQAIEQAVKLVQEEAQSIAPSGRLRNTLFSLSVHAPAHGVPLLLSLEKVNPDLVKSVLLALPDTSPLQLRDELSEELSESQVADLYRLYLRVFPEKDEPEDRTGGVRVGFSPRDFRTVLIRELIRRGTFEAVSAFNALAAEASDPIAIQFHRRQAEHAALVETWVAPAPGQVMDLFRNASTRLVRSGEELLLVLVESARRYEAELQGETPQNFTLWDGFTPKNEERFSDALKAHFERELKGRGILSQREVEIRSKQGSAGATGERTDIHVTAINHRPGNGQANRVRVIIEVKGCWNQGVNTAMESQLRDRYLRDNDCQHGLYLVGWFICPQWNAQDQRRRAARRLMPATIVDAQQQFDQQATNLSTNGIQLAAVVLNATLR